MSPQLKASCQLGYGVPFSLVCSTLIILASMAGAVAETGAVAEEAAGNSIAAATTKQVYLAETTKQTSNGDLGEIVPIGDVLVTVERGDSLSSILRGNLGSLSALGVVTRYNNLDTPDTLEPGQDILIPAYLFPGQPDTQPVQSAFVPATDTESTVQTKQSEGQYRVVDLAELSLAAGPEVTMQSIGAEDQYLDVDLTELSLAADSENTMQLTESEDQYLVVDLSELSAASNPETTMRSTMSGEQYTIVDLTAVKTTPDRRIRVNRGDSLSSILRENFGSLRALQEVTRYNNLDTPDVLQPGTIILIPGYL